jgi:hypothetical protein
MYLGYASHVRCYNLEDEDVHEEESSIPMPSFFFPVRILCFLLDADLPILGKEILYCVHLESGH